MFHFLKNIFFPSCLFFYNASSLAEPLFEQPFLDNLMKNYSPLEKDLIQEDLRNISELVLRNMNTPKELKPIYLATAGAPGAHKSTILETLMHKEPRFKDLAYIDPDTRGLRFMINTYYSQSMNYYEIANAKSFQAAQQRAYDYWRDASNFIANTLLEKASISRFNIGHGTTLTSDKVAIFLHKIKSNGYSPTIVLCHAPDNIRVQAVAHRAKVQGFYQSSPEDVREKAKLFLQRIPLYFDFADEMLIYWTDRLFHPVHAASIRSGKLKVVDTKAYEGFTRYLNKQHNSPNYWQDLLKSKKIVNSPLEDA